MSQGGFVVTHASTTTVSKDTLLDSASVLASIDASSAGVRGTGTAVHVTAARRLDVASHGVAAATAQSTRDKMSGTGHSPGRLQLPFPGNGVASSGGGDQAGVSAATAGRQFSSLFSSDHRGQRDVLSTAGADVAGLGPGGTLKEQEDVIQRLQKHNFNLMLRIYYLEERLAAYTGGDGEPVSESELQEQVVELKVLIEERSQELEDRNVLLVKVRATLLCLPGPRSMAVTLCYHHVQARNAIESLQADLEFARLQVDEARSAAPSLAEVRATMVMARSVASARPRECHGVVRTQISDRERVVSELRQSVRSVEARERTVTMNLRSMEQRVRAGAAVRGLPMRWSPLCSSSRQAESLSAQLRVKDEQLTECVATAVPTVALVDVVVAAIRQVRRTRSEARCCQR